MAMQRGTGAARGSRGQLTQSRVSALGELLSFALFFRTLTHPLLPALLSCLCWRRLLEEERAISLLQSKLASKNEKYKRTKAALAALQQRLQQAEGDNKPQDRE